MLSLGGGTTSGQLEAVEWGQEPVEEWLFPRLHGGRRGRRQGIGLGSHMGIMVPRVAMTLDSSSATMGSGSWIKALAEGAAVLGCWSEARFPLPCHTCVLLLSGLAAHMEARQAAVLHYGGGDASGYCCWCSSALLQNGSCHMVVGVARQGDAQAIFPQGIHRRGGAAVGAPDQSW